jgi:hypothetical protein
MTARYIGRKPVRLASGEILKTNDTTDKITDKQAKARYGFEVVEERKKETIKKTKKESYDE